MNSSIPVDALLPVVGAIQAGFLAVAISSQRPVGESRVARYATVFLAILAATILLIAADHAGLRRSALPIEALERVLTVVSGPVFLLLVAASLGRKSDWRVVFAPALCLLLADAAAAIPFLLIVAAQASYTAAAITTLVGARPDALVSSRRRWRATFAVVAAMLAIHAAQAVRFAAPDLAEFQNVVPNIAAAAVLVLGATVLWSARLPALELLGTRRSSDADTLSAIVARLDDMLVARRMCKDPSLSVADAAAALNVTARELSRALAEVKGTTFPEHVVRTRVKLALQLLRDPAEQKTSMEAIGLLVGFGSRSAFYSAFSKHTGETPSAYRKRSAENGCPNS